MSATHKTGHAEAVLIQFDSNEVSYEQLLDVFWSIHDPTTKNRQGPDIGSQYRSMIAYHTQEQELLAKKSKADLEKSGRFERRHNCYRNCSSIDFLQSRRLSSEILSKERWWKLLQYPVQEIKD